MVWDSEIDLLAGAKVEAFYIVILYELLYINLLIRGLQNRDEELVKAPQGVQKLHQNLEGIVVRKFVEDGGPMKVKNLQSIVIKYPCQNYGLIKLCF